MDINSLADVILNGADTTWLDDAACADMDIDDFFVSAGHSINPASIRACRACPVRVDCLHHAYHQSPPLTSSGYFGGMSPGQRSKSSYEEALVFISRDSAA
jgi:hypothetical protein